MAIQENGKPITTSYSDSIIGEFDDIVDQLRDMLDRLQTRVVTLTNDMQVASEISTRVANILDINTLLPELAEEIKEGFDLHHVNIYTVDEKSNTLVLSAASGEAGRKLLEQGYTVSLDDERNIAAFAVRTQHAAIANNVEEETHFDFKDLVEGTKSKMAVPMITQGRVAGVLAVQGDTENHFDETDIRVKTTLAEQLAVAIEGATAFSQVREAREQATASSELMQSVLNNIPVRVFSKDVNGVYRFCNNLFLQDAGLSSLDEIIGKTDYELPWADTEADAYRADDMEVMETNEPKLNIEEPQTNASGETIWLLTSKVPLKDSDGQISGILGLYSDITERKQQQRRLEQANFVVGNSPVVLFRWVANENWPVEFVSENVSQFGYTAEELLSGETPYASIVHPDDLQRVAREVQTYTEQGVDSFNQQYRIVGKKGQVYWTDDRTVIERDEKGNVTHYQGIVVDITDRKQAEERETLAYEIGQQLNTVQDPTELLQFAVDVLAGALDYYHAHIYVYDYRRALLRVAAGLGDAGALMVREQHSISYDAPRSLVAQAARSLDPVVVQDVSSSIGHLPNPLIPRTQSEAAVPLFIGSELLGVLDVQSDRPDSFGDDELRLLNVVASQLSIALSNARQLEATERQLRDIALANQASRIINETDEPLDMMDQIMELVCRSIGSDNAAFLEYHQDEERWQGMTAYGMTREFIQTAQNPGPEIPHGMAALQENRIIAVDNAYDYEGFPMEYVESIGIKSVAAMPIIGRRGAIGVVFFNFNEDFHTFDDNEIALLDGISRQISTGIEAKRLEEETREIARQYQELVENAPEAIFVADAETGQFVQASRSGAELFEVEMKSLLQTTPVDYAPEYQENGRLSTEVAFEMIQRAAVGETVVDDWLVQTAKGNLVQTEIRITNMPDDGSGRLRVRATLIDITERKEAETERNRLYNMSIDMIGSAGFDGYFKDLNPAWERTLGFTPEELKAEPFISFVHPDDVESTNAEAAKLAEGMTAINFVNRYRTKDGGWRWLSWNAVPDYESQMIYFVTHDITEERAREETIQRRARELELVAEVNTQVSDILDPTEMLKKVVDLTKEQFNLYHAHIYLLENEQLVLAAGAGAAGDRMKAANHRIPMAHENSIVAQAARTADSVITNDVTRNENFLPNPLIPRTRSELAVPLIYNDEVIGVLDIQSDKAGAFDENDAIIQTILAGQVTVALQNARAFASEQRLRRSNELVAQVSSQISGILDPSDMLKQVVELTKEQFQLYHAHVYLLEGKHLLLAEGAGQPGERMKAAGHSIPLDHIHSIVANVARNGESLIVNDLTQVATSLPNPLLPKTRSELGVPIIYNRKVVGVLDVQSEYTDYFTEEDASVLQVLAGQIAIALQNAEAFETEQQLRRQNEQVAQITAALSAAETEQDILEAFDGFAQQTDVNMMTLVYPQGNDDFVEIAALRSGEGSPIPLDTMDSTVLRVGQLATIKDVRQNLHRPQIIQNMANFDLLDETTAAFMEESNIAASINLPLTSGDRWIGLLGLNYDSPRQFDNDLIDILERIRPTLSSAVLSRRAFLREQEARRENERRARELETVAQVSTATSTLLDVNDLLKQVSDLTKIAFDLYHAHIYLYNNETEMLELAAGAGDAGDMMKANKHAIPLRHETSIVAQAARDRRGIRVNDVTDAPNFLPNPLLPETRSEMALPMFVSDKLIGVLDVQSSQPSRFDNEDLQIKTTLAAQVAVAVQNARAYEEQQIITEQLREVDRLKSQFLASMSHELRTPLNSIIGYSEVLLDGGDGDLSEDAEEDIEIIYTSGKHLLAIINDILDLAKIEANQMKLHKEPTDLVKILRDVIKTNQVLIGEKPIDLILDSEVDELIVPIDQLRIRQVVFNLFSNAVKFTENGSITIELSMLDDETARIAVTDTGIGISEEGLQIVFDQFRQVDGSSTRKAGGTGLGLTITRYLVQMHGGDIHAESAEGEGTTFWFTLPLIATEAQEVVG